MNTLNRYQRTAAHLMVGTIFGAALTLGSMIAGTQAEAAAPYGGCAEAWQAPKSEGADWCREQGWTVRKRVVLNPHAVLRYWNFETCSTEDGSGSDLPCGWLGNKDGNGRGLSYYVIGPWEKHRAYFLWSPNPLKDHPKREWVSRSLADALAEGSAHDATTRDWEQCWVKYGKQVTKVACPDGYAEEW